MREAISYYHFDSEEKQKLIRALLPLRVRLREVPPEEYGMPVGALAGILKEGKVSAEEEAGVTAPMLVMAGLTGARLDEVLLALRRNGLRIPYKAVLTASNQTWTGGQLFAELVQEHQKMSEL